MGKTGVLYFPNMRVILLTIVFFVLVIGSGSSAFQDICSGKRQENNREVMQEIKMKRKSEMSNSYPKKTNLMCHKDVVQDCSSSNTEDDKQSSTEECHEFQSTRGLKRKKEIKHHQKAKKQKEQHPKQGSSTGKCHNFHNKSSMKRKREAKHCQKAKKQKKHHPNQFEESDLESSSLSSDDLVNHSQNNGTENDSSWTVESVEENSTDKTQQLKSKRRYQTSHSQAKRKRYEDDLQDRENELANFDPNERNVLYNEYVSDRSEGENLNEDQSDVSDEDDYDLTESEDEKDLRIWIIRNKVPHNQSDELLGILRRKKMKYLPASTKTFLKTNSKFTIEPMEGSDGSPGEFVYIGIRAKLVARIQRGLHPALIIYLIINVDGFCPFKSSNRTIWPILVKIFSEEDVYKPFTAGAYSGTKKPKSANEFLFKFVQELNELLRDGIVIDGTHYVIKIKFFVCDFPARVYLKYWVGHASLHACERCEIEAITVGNTVTFQDLNAPKITDLDFITYKNPECHHDVSILTMIEDVKPVTHFILDPMHNNYLGNNKRILDNLLGSSTAKSNKRVKLSATLREELKRRTTMIKKDIPDEFPRKMRSSDDHAKYKAVEHKFFLLYAAPIVLKKLLKDELYKNILLLSMGCRLMSQRNATSHVAQARQFFKKYVEDAISLYGPQFVSLVVHYMIHVCDDVENTGCNMNELSAFCFESYLYLIGKALRCPRYILTQYCNRMEEEETYIPAERKSHRVVDVMLTVGGKVKKLKYKEMILADSQPNNTVLLENNKVAEIQKFTFDKRAKTLAVVKIFKKQSVFTDPCSSDSMNIWEISHLSKEEMIIPISNITQKFVRLNLNFAPEDEMRSFILPLLHS